MLTPRLQHSINKLTAQHLLRKRKIIDRTKLSFNFCSNDYLNLSNHPAVIKAYIDGAQEYGLGSGASAQVSGYTKPHYQLEEKFAEFLQRDKALLFNSGYHANLGVLTTFADRTSTVIADKFCHASLIDGIVLSRAQCKRYRHNDYQHADALLCSSATNDSLLVTESVFSIQGNIADVKQLATIAKKHNAILVVDDAHGIGVLGKHGGGICDEYQLSQLDAPCLVTPFGKAIGSFGAVVSGSTETIEALQQFSRTYRYSTALPPAICVATLAALNVIATESWRRQQLHHLINFFIKGAKERALRLISNDATPIKSIIVDTNKMAIDMQHKLAEAGYHVACIRPPTVPINQTCIRISLNCLHIEEQITHLLDLISAHDKYKN